MTIKSSFLKILYLHLKQTTNMQIVDYFLFNTVAKDKFLSYCNSNYLMLFHGNSIQPYIIIKPNTSLFPQ